MQPNRLLLLIALLLALAAIASADSSARYENTSYGFRIDPGGRKHSPSPANDVDTFALGIVSDRGWQLSVRVAPVDPASSAADLRARAIARLTNDSRYTMGETFEDTVADRAAAGIAVDYRTGGVQYRIGARFLVANDLRYIVQSSAPAAAYDSHAPEIDAVIDTLELLPVPAAERREFRLEGLEDRCGSELSWEPTWEAAAKRAQVEGKPVLVAARFYPGFDLSDGMSSGALFDEDVIALIEERCVPLRLRKDDSVPFADYDRYGLGPHTFGQALLLVSSDGDVLDETFRSDAVTVDDFLVRALARLDDDTKIPAGLEGTRQCIARGSLTVAAVRLTDAESVEELRLRADLNRRLRRGEAALRDLEMIRELAADDVPSDLDLDEAIVRMLSGEPRKARALIASFLRKQRKHPRRAEALYLGGALAHQAGKDEAASKAWTEIVESHADDRWAWKAAAALGSTALALGIRSHLAWPDEEEMKDLRTRTRARAIERSTVPSAAARFLIEQQRADGGWIYPATIGASPEGPPHAIEQAVDALVADSLVRMRSMGGVEAAIERSLEGLFSARRKTEAEGELVHYMDYWVWAKGYQLRFVANCLDAGIGPRKRLQKLAAALVDELGDRQRPTGGWSYYVTRNLETGNEDTQSISFVTAPALLTLLRAREVGIEVPDKMIDRALDCLEAMRNSDGSVDYMGGIGSGGSSQGVAGAAGRIPLCTLALHRGGRVGLDDVRTSLKLFAAYAHTFAREQGKNLMHAGPDTQGSHYLLFDYAATAAAVAALPPEERAPHRARLEDLIDACRYDDGGYIDNPGMGRACGTALALEAYDLLDPAN